MKAIGYIFLVLIFIHGLIHLMGYSRAFHMSFEKSDIAPISKVQGTLWFIATCLFIATSVSLFFNKDWWWIVALASVFVSQFLIFSAWQDAKFGTILNGITLFVILLEVNTIYSLSKF